MRSRGAVWEKQKAKDHKQTTGSRTLPEPRAHDAFSPLMGAPKQLATPTAAATTSIRLSVCS